MIQIALAQPPMSSLRKMSAKTVISSQIQMKNRKNQSIDQSTWPDPKSSASTTFLDLHGGNGDTVAWVQSRSRRAGSKTAALTRSEHTWPTWPVAVTLVTGASHLPTGPPLPG